MILAQDDRAGLETREKGAVVRKARKGMLFRRGLARVRLA